MPGECAARRNSEMPIEHDGKRLKDDRILDQGPEG